MIATRSFTSFGTWRQLACYAGVAPFEHSSGTSIKGRTKVSDIADKKMKSLLQMCVLSAVKCDKEIKGYYEKKKAEDKPTMLVMNNVRAKLLARAFAVIKRGTPFVNTQKFAA
jgi:transposase